MTKRKLTRRAPPAHLYRLSRIIYMKCPGADNFLPARLPSLRKRGFEMWVLSDESGSVEWTTQLRRIQNCQAVCAPAIIKSVRGVSSLRAHARAAGRDNGGSGARRSSKVTIMSQRARHSSIGPRLSPRTHFLFLPNYRARISNFSSSHDNSRRSNWDFLFLSLGSLVFLFLMTGQDALLTSLSAHCWPLCVARVFIFPADCLFGQPGMCFANTGFLSAPLLEHRHEGSLLHF